MANASPARRVADTEYYTHMAKLLRFALIVLICLAIAIVFNGIFWLFYTFVRGLF